MGSCISKCKPKKKFKEDPNRHVQDKLVISQDPPTISPVRPEKITITASVKPLSPAPSTSSSSTASFSSFSCSTTSKCVSAASISSSSSLSSSYSSSSVLMKDRSFSNDFLWSCAKENPHAVSRKENLDPSSLLVSSPFVRKSKQIVGEISSTPKKRARASSPTLVRQKSFRKEQSYSCGGATPHRGLRSPSPSRRFNGESNRVFPNKESCYRNQVVSRRINAVIGSVPKRESFRAPTKEECIVRKNGGFSQHINSRIDGGVGKEIDVVMEDINNPLIALDCFIFL